MTKFAIVSAMRHQNLGSTEAMDIQDVLLNDQMAQYVFFVFMFF